MTLSAAKRKRTGETSRLARRIPRPLGYSGPKGMEKIYEEYRTSPMNRGLYKSYFNASARQGYSSKNKSSYTPERHIQQRSEGVRKDTTPYETKQTDTPEPSNKTEQKTEQKNIQELYDTEISTPKQLPIVEIGEKKFFLDERLQELRDIEQPWNSISFKDLDLTPEKTGQDGRYDIEKQADVKDVFSLPKYENTIEFGQTDSTQKKRPSTYDDKIESRW